MIGYYLETTKAAWMGSFFREQTSTTWWSMMYIHRLLYTSKRKGLFCCCTTYYATLASHCTSCHHPVLLFRRGPGTQCSTIIIWPSSKRMVLAMEATFLPDPTRLRLSNENASRFSAGQPEPKAAFSIRVAATI